MEEKTILKISVAVILLGLGFLFLYAEELELDVLESLETAPIEEEVVLKGEITRLTESEKVTFLELEATKAEKMSVLLFNEEEINFKAGDYVEVTGTVEDYEGKKEIIANKIVLK